MPSSAVRTAVLRGRELLDGGGGGSDMGGPVLEGA